jgi:hypothetical protein
MTKQKLTLSAITLGLIKWFITRLAPKLYHLAITDTENCLGQLISLIGNSIYFPTTRNIKWTQALLRGLLKIAVNDTNIIAQELQLSSCLRDTELEIIDHLAGNHTWRSDNSRPVHKVKTTGHGHFPIKATKKGRCEVCKKHGKDSSTTYLCAICQVHLHPEHMTEYHQ